MHKIELMVDGIDNYFYQEAFKTLRTNLQFCGQNVRVISLTSSEPSEGKSMVSLGMTCSFAELGKKVLLIDADMRKSAMTGRIRSTEGRLCGLSEFLSGMNPLEDSIVETQFQGVHLMPSGQYPPNPSELLNSSDFEAMVQELRSLFDYIVIDTPPLGSVIDAAIVSSFCDGTALVIGDTKISRKFIQGVIDQLDKSGARLLGVIRNQSKAKQRSFFAKDGYGYRHKNRKKYYVQT